MKHSSHHGSEAASACRTACLILLVITAGLMAFSLYAPSPTLHILIFLLLQPLAVNALLMLPMENIPREAVTRSPDPELPDLPRKRLPALLARLGRRLRCLGRDLSWRLRRLVLPRRIYLVTGLIAGAVVCLYIHLFLHRPKAGPVELLVPVLLLSVFFSLLVVDSWLRYLLREQQEETRYRYLLRNLEYSVRSVRFLFLGAALVSALPLLGLADLWKPLYYGFSVLLALQSAELLYLVTVRFVRQELNTRPDLRLFAKDRSTLSMLDHLEQNTGITMRSLWSLGYIRRLLPWGLVLLGALLWLSTGLVQIGPHQQGALYRLGRLQPELLEPGLHLTLPWPLDSVTPCDTRNLRELTVGYIPAASVSDNLWTEAHGGEEGKYLLGDGNELVSINLRLEYRIDNLRDYLTCNADPEALLESAAYEVVTAHTVSTNLETLLDVDRRAFSRSFQQELTARIQDYRTGLEVVNVIIESIHPPVEVAEVYQNIISAEIMAEKYILESEAWANVLVARARDAYNTDVNAAQARSHESIAAATAAVAEFTAGIEAESLYGDEYRYYKYMDAVTRAYSDARLVLVDGSIDGGGLYFGRLPK